MNKDAKKLISIIGTVLATIVTAGLTVYVARGRRRLNAAVIPDAIEDRIDKVVYWLDRQLGKEWVDSGLDVIQTVLLGSLPKPLATLAGAVFEAEKTGRREGWRGLQKRDYAKGRA